MSKKPPASRPHKTNPKAAAAFAQALAWHQQGNLGQALALYQKTLDRDPKHTDALVNTGLICLQRGEYEAGAEWIQRSLKIDPRQPDALSNLGVAQAALKNHAGAVDTFSRAIALNPRDPVLYNNRGGALKDMYRQAEAIADFTHAISLAPAYADAYNNRGLAFYNLRQNDDALADFDKAIAANPNFAVALRHKGLVLQELKRHTEAADCYKKALAIAPDLPLVLGYLFYCKQELCEWQDYSTLVDTITDLLRGDQLPIVPFVYLALPGDPELQLRCARRYAREFSSPESWPVEPLQSGQKIRIGYFSPDFRNHAVTHLVAGLIEQHDRSRFEIHGFNIGPVVNDPWRARMQKGFDHFHDVLEKSDDEIVRLAREIGLDIAVDLTGYTQFSRTSVFARRAAPVQVQYLGYVGTMGTRFMDYLIADSVVIPENERPFYDEKIIYLPHSYQVNDDRKIVSDRQFTRQELRLPENGFVFCCHNNHYKLTPDVFHLWMRLLNSIPGSVLWLIGGNEEAIRNLKKEAAGCGIDPERLVFAEKVGHAEYLARFRAADLFLDTFNYNAGTIASEALWSGLPVLTCTGNTYVSRMATSLLHAVGLPELAAATPAEYEATALRLASNPEEMAALARKLRDNKTACPLFDTRLTTRHIERGLIQAHERHKAGLPPAHIFIEP